MYVSLYMSRLAVITHAACCRVTCGTVSFPTASPLQDAVEYSNWPALKDTSALPELITLATEALVTSFVSIVLSSLDHKQDQITQSGRSDPAYLFRTCMRADFLMDKGFLSRS